MSIQVPPICTFNRTYQYRSRMRRERLLDTILPRVGIMTTSPASSTPVVVLPDDPIKRLRLDPTQEPGLAGLVDTKNPLDILLALPPTYYMEYRSRGGNDDNSISFSMHLHFTESSGGVLVRTVLQSHWFYVSTPPNAR